MDKQTASDTIDKAFGFDSRYFADRDRRKNYSDLMDKWILIKEADYSFNSIIEYFVLLGSNPGITLDFQSRATDREKKILEQAEQRLIRRMDDYKLLNKMLS